MSVYLLPNDYTQKHLFSIQRQTGLRAKATASGIQLVNPNQVTPVRINRHTWQPMPPTGGNAA